MIILITVVIELPIVTAVTVVNVLTLSIITLQYYYCNSKHTIAILNTKLKNLEKYHCTLMQPIKNWGEIQMRPPALPISNASVLLGLDRVHEKQQ